ncbi:fibronectin type III domain-containing protein [Streptomyces sp. NPDC059698]|uniref:fibronectin type III domain-containing protein n=1 Tax=unclassified Streptomyces TaxID=2593676 RepID=UPI0009402163|nr:fibronectin type III domain-containing protein [Streptomyces sp. CB02366]OKJ37832.1 hydrolase [Streptomyces sp. CB02366]TVP33309.1 hydrolase [Streptomyces griseus subsp. griseus]WSS58460.1 fibronectin type III domain-containing protein [Streptomyces sp. NBC_01178]
MEGTTVQRPHISAALACSALLLAPLLSACGGSAEADTQPPGAPRGVTAQASSSTSVHVMWKAASDDEKVGGYEVYRGKTKVKSVPATKTMIDVGGLAASTDYTFSVRAKDTAGNLSEPSEVVPVTTQATPPQDDEPPTAPAKLTGRADGSRTATLTWGAAKDDVGVTSYDIYQEDSRIHSVPASETGAKLTGLRPGTVYTFTVRARDASDKSSADSNALDLTTESAPGAPASTAPTGLRTEVAEGGSRFTLDLSWDQPETGGPVPAYQLYLNGRLTTTIVWGGTPPEGRATYRLDLADPPGTRYSVKLRAKLPDGTWGDFSAQRTVVLPG